MVSVVRVPGRVKFVQMENRGLQGWQWGLFNVLCAVSNGPRASIWENEQVLEVHSHVNALNTLKSG